jgi:glycosyltransferase involved in cell wall biosynthesis
MRDHPASVIIPCYNEDQTIGTVVAGVKTHNPEYEVIVVDDGSEDKTSAVAQKAGAIVFRHPYNIGNGAALKTGIREANGEILIFMDADGQHRPEDIQLLVDEMDNYDMVVGARTASQQSSLLRRIGNTIYNRLATYVTKFDIQDLTSGFRCVKAQSARKFLYLLPNTYSYPTTSTMYILRTGRTLKYVHVNVRHRQSGTSQIRIFNDGVKFFLIIVKICTLFSPFRVFLPASGFFFCTGLLYYLYTYLAAGRFTNMGALLFMTSFLIFMIGLVSEQVSNLVYQKSEIDMREYPLERIGGNNFSEK